MEEEADKQRMGYKDRHYEAWVHFTASVFIKDWDIDWNMERCREGLKKAGYIDEGAEVRGRERVKRTVTSSKPAVGEILAAGGNGEKHWFRDTGKGYEIDITIDSGAVATIVPMGTLPGEGSQRNRGV